jgi:hypothetical protein
MENAGQLYFTRYNKVGTGLGEERVKGEGHKELQVTTRDNRDTRD